MTLSAFDTALTLVKHFEGFRAEAYKDPVGVWTIGYGETVHPQAHPRGRMTEPEAATLLANRLLSLAFLLGRYIDGGLMPYQAAALLSFTYNVGTSAFARSTMRKKLNAGAPAAEVAAEFLRWNKAGGRVLRGLKRRRAAESIVFLGGEVETAIEAVEVNP